MSDNRNDETKRFANLAQQDSTNATQPAPATEGGKRRGMTVLGKVILFLVLPTLVGSIGLYMGYLASLGDPNREMKFDVDFALPFVLTLSMAIVIGFQTRGFRSDKPEPLVSWPKVKKRKKVVHRHVVIAEDGTETLVEETTVEDDKKTH